VRTEVKRGLLAAAGAVALAYLTLGEKAAAMAGGAAVFGTVGAMLCWFALPGIRAYQLRLARGRRAPGIVTRIRLDASDSETTHECPIVEFVNAAGEKVEFEASIRRSPPRYRIGDAVEVLYDAGEDGKPDIAGTEWTGLVAVAAFGLLALAIGLLCLRALGGVVIGALFSRGRSTPAPLAEAGRPVGERPADGERPSAPVVSTGTSPSCRAPPRGLRCRRPAWGRGW
jgi:hypothetical protein